MAVELCQTALWIESVDPGKPLTFLEAHIQCGDSLVGVSDLAALARGIPDEAYKPLIGDDKLVASSARKANKGQREQHRQGSLFATGPANLSGQARALEELPEDDLREVEAKARAFESYRHGASWWTTKVAWTSTSLHFFDPRHGARERSRVRMLRTKSRQPQTCGQHCRAIPRKGVLTTPRN